MKHNQKLTRKLHGKTLAEILAIEDGNAINKFVQDLLDSGEALTRPVGDRGENAGQIMIATDPIKALTEVIGSNTQDAMTARFVEETGQSPSNPRDSVEKRLGFHQGRFEDKRVSNNHIKQALEDVQITLRGHIPRGVQPSYSTIDVRDHGVGVRPEDVSSTLCGLGGGGKACRPEYAGAFAQGAKAVLFFANAKEGLSQTVCQLLITRHHQSGGEVSVSFIVFNRRDGKDGGDLARTPRWEYLVNPNTNQPWVFEAYELGMEFESGTLIRLYDYPLGLGPCGKFQRNTSSLDSRLRRTLPDPLLPMKVRDLRTSAKGNPGWRRYLKSSKASFNHMGTLHKLRQDKKVRLFKDYKLDLGKRSTATLRLVVFDYDAPTDYLENFASFEKPFMLTLNGQTHGEISKHLLTHDVGFSALNKRFFAIVDLDEASWEAKTNLFSSTRESVRQTPDLVKLKSRIVATLQSDPLLQELNKEYRDRSSSSTGDDEELLAMKIVNKFIRNRKTHLPHGTRKKRIKKDETGDSPVKILDIPYNDPPTLFELQGESQRNVAQGRNFRVRVNTDAYPDLFDEYATFKVDCPYTYLTHQSTSQNDGGHKYFVFTVSCQAPVGATASISMILTPKNGPPLSCTLEVGIVEPLVKPPEDEGLPFSIKTIDVESFLDTVEMTRDDVSILRQEGPEKVVYLNMLNSTLQNQIDAYQADGRFKNSAEVITAFKAVYLSEAIITAWEIFIENENSDMDLDLRESLIRRGSKSALSTLMRTTKTVEGIQKYLS